MKNWKKWWVQQHFPLFPSVFYVLSTNKQKTKVESVQLGKILDLSFPLLPLPRGQVKCCGWNGEWGRGWEVYSLGLD